MANSKQIGGIVQTYLKYDPVKFPSPTQPPSDIISSLMNGMLATGNSRELTAEELARAIRIDPEQFSGFGPSIDQMQAALEERKRKILSSYETKSVQLEARKRFQKHSKNGPKASPDLKHHLLEAVQQEQLYDLERIYYLIGDDASPFAQHIAQLIARLATKYEIDELVSKYQFTGQQSLGVSEAIEIKEELEKIDELLEQLKEARDTAQIGIIDLDQLSEFMDQESMQALGELQQAIEEYVRDVAEQQGLAAKNGKFELTPQAYRVFQSSLLSRIFSNLKESKSGRHNGNVTGEGAVELQSTKPYEFGDSLTHMDIPQTFINAMLRSNSQTPRPVKAGRHRNSSYA